MREWPVTNARRFETYVRWSLYVMVATPGLSFLLGAFGLLDAAATLTGGIALLGLLGTAAIALSVANVAAARWGLDQVVGTTRPWPRWLIPVWVVSVSAITVIAMTSLGPYTLVAIAGAVLSVVAALTPLVSLRLSIAICGGLSVLMLALQVLVRSGGFIPIVALAWFLILGSWSMGWMLTVMRELQAAHETRAKLGVAEERLRIMRDLHDVFGRTLAAIAVKSELASELGRRGRHDKAADEMAAVHDLAETAGQEVRKVVRGELQPEWSDELDGARALLASAGITCQITGDTVPPTPAKSLAWVVREGVTNILRHSRATHVTLSTAVERDEVVLSLTNDGLERSSGTVAHAPTTPGNGLTTMAERLHAIGGSLEHHRDGDWFRLQATVPLQEAA